MDEQEHCFCDSPDHATIRFTLHALLCACVRRRKLWDLRKFHCVQTFQADNDGELRKDRASLSCFVHFKMPPARSNQEQVLRGTRNFTGCKKSKTSVLSSGWMHGTSCALCWRATSYRADNKHRDALITTTTISEYLFIMRN